MILKTKISSAITIFILFFSFFLINNYSINYCHAQASTLSYSLMDSEGTNSDTGLVFSINGAKKGNLFFGLEIGWYNWDDALNFNWPGIGAFNIDVDLKKYSLIVLYKLADFSKDKKDKKKLPDGIYLDIGPTFYDMDVSMAGLTANEDDFGYHYGITIKTSNIVLKIKKHEAEFNGVDLDSKEFSIGYMFTF